MSEWVSGRPNVLHASHYLMEEMARLIRHEPPLWWVGGAEWVSGQVGEWMGAQAVS